MYFFEELLPGVIQDPERSLDKLILFRGPYVAAIDILIFTGALWHISYTIDAKDLSC